MSVFDISIEGFSGPLDLLCTLVDTGEFAASRIKIRKLVHIYGAYLAQSKHASAETLVEFFYLAAGLLLSKTKSLLPSLEPENGDPEDLNNLDGLATEAEEAALMETLARYRPYRAAAWWLADRQAIAEKTFRRDLLLREPAPESQADSGSGLEPGNIGTVAAVNPEVEFEIGDVYYLARVWWGLFERWHQRKGVERRLLEEQLAADESADWDGFAGAVPDEALIENRIAELDAQLSENEILSLRELCDEARELDKNKSENAVRMLVVTLLALLEMCRMGKAEVKQDILFGDVRITRPAFIATEIISNTGDSAGAAKNNTSGAVEVQ